MMWGMRKQICWLWVFAFCLPGILRAANHPLDALDASEIASTTSILRKAGYVNDKTLIASITLQKPAKADVLNWRKGEPFTRTAKAILRRNTKTSEAVVDLSKGETLSHREIPGRSLS